MKIIWTIILTLLGAAVLHASDSRLRDGKVEFAVSSVNGEPAWTAKEKQGLIDKYAPFASTSPIAVVDNIPTKSEVALSTSASFRNYSEFKNSLDGYVSDQSILQLKQKLDVANEVGDTAKAGQLSAQLSTLKAARTKETVEAGVDLSR